MARSMTAIVLSVLLSSLSGGSSSADVLYGRPVNDGPILELIGSVEGPAGYDDFFRGAPSRPPKPISQMTIREVLEYQTRLQRQGSESSAVGRFQFIRRTLAWLVDLHDIDQDRRFNRVTQDYLARVLLNNCQYYQPDVSAHEIGNCLARAWAALPVISGDGAGRSFYGGVGSNRALTSREEVLSALGLRFQGGSSTLAVRLAARGDLPVIRPPGAGDFAERIPLSR